MFFGIGGAGPHGIHGQGTCQFRQDVPDGGVLGGSPDQLELFREAVTIHIYPLVAPGARVGIGAVHPVGPGSQRMGAGEVIRVGLVGVRQDDEGALLLPGIVRIEIIGGYPRVHNPYRAAQGEGIRGGDGEAGGVCLRGGFLSLLLHVKNQSRGKRSTFLGIDEGAGSGTQDDVTVGDGEGGGIDDAAPGDFQSAVFQSHGGIVPQAGIARRRHCVPG